MRKTVLFAGTCLLMQATAFAQTPNCQPPLNHISDFISVKPGAQPDSIRIPSSHVFQLLVQSGEPYTDTSLGVVKGLFDFTGYVSPTGSSTSGYINLNHEGSNQVTGGVSVLDVEFDTTTRLWVVTEKTPVDFSGIEGTGRNCSGGITPWGTTITSEETLPTRDDNNDGYQDIGWQVEIDPVTRSIRDYNNDNIPDKLWKMGRMSHENIVVANDSVTIYETNDENPGYVFKYVAHTPGDLSDGDLYVLRLDDEIGIASSGSWRKVPNSTPTECNNVKTAAGALGATNFRNLEDIEISPVDGMIYFVSKESSRVYRFRDFGTVVNDFEIFAGNPSQNYLIEHEDGTDFEQWRDGNDNLTFDNLGNLYVLQDGGRNHIWMITPCHTQQNPDIRLFAVTPAGCEPTGMTFSPDFRYMFVSLQHPSGSNTYVQKDAAGNDVVFNKETAIVIAHKGYLGDSDSTVIPNNIAEQGNVQESKITSLYPNPTSADLNMSISSAFAETAIIRIYGMSGNLVMQTETALIKGDNKLSLPTTALAPGTYQVIINTNQNQMTSRFVKQ